MLKGTLATLVAVAVFACSGTVEAQKCASAFNQLTRNMFGGENCGREITNGQAAALWGNYCNDNCTINSNYAGYRGHGGCLGGGCGSSAYTSAFTSYGSYGYPGGSSCGGCGGGSFGYAGGCGGGCGSSCGGGFAQAYRGHHRGCGKGHGGCGRGHGGCGKSHRGCGLHRQSAYSIASSCGGGSCGGSYGGSYGGSCNSCSSGGYASTGFSGYSSACGCKGCGGPVRGLLGKVLHHHRGGRGYGGRGCGGHGCKLFSCGGLHDRMFSSFYAANGVSSSPSYFGGYVGGETGFSDFSTSLNGSITSGCSSCGGGGYSGSSYSGGSYSGGYESYMPPASGGYSQPAASYYQPTIATPTMIQPFGN